MKLHSKNEYAETWIGTQRQPYIVHGPVVLDSRASLAGDLLKCAVRTGIYATKNLAPAMCDLSAEIHAEWGRRGWSIPAPPMDGEPDDNPVGFERGK